MVGANNYSFVMAMGNNARVHIHSTDTQKKTWVQLRETSDSGSTLLRLADPTGWEVGDRIVMASTDYDLNQAEDFTITAVANNGTNITIDRSTNFMHYGVEENLY